MLENTAVLNRPAVLRAMPPVIFSPSREPLDPLADDRFDDAPLLTTERRLHRLAIVAADTGARFARERSPHDPVAWLLAPRELFGGARAIDACQEKAPFLRATLLHGLGMGLDADPAELDDLLSEDEDGCEGEGAIDEEPVGVADPSGQEPARLFVCTVDGPIGTGGRRLQALLATVTVDGEAVRRRVAVRYGHALATLAEVREGFDAEAPLARTLLSSSLVRRLEAAAADPAGPFGDGLDLQVEQRFVA